MDVFTFAYSLFQALAALPQLTDFLSKFAAGVTAWALSQAKEGDKQAIVDAVALSLKAQSQEDRYAALDSWRAVFKRPRVSA